jgi:transglutaminase-like putative cysteine protease
MRFASAHKASTYLMVGFAYLALVAGGGLSATVSLGALIGLVGSWWWEPPLIRFEKLAWVWTALSMVALTYSLFTAIVTTDFIGVSAQFLVWLTVAKAFNRRAARDWQQLYLLAFLMLVAGSVLNPDLTYGVCFLGFVVSATWAVTMLHLRREMEDNLLIKHASDRASERVEVRRILDSRRIVGARFFLGTGALSLGVFLGAALVFLALPRVGMGFFLKSRGGLTLSGFSDGVKLGGHGVIKHDPTVVMRVEVDARYGGRHAPELYWRGVAFDRYRDGQWARSREAPATRQTLEQSPARDRRLLLWSGPALPTPEIDGLAASLVRQDVWLEPLDSDVLFGATTPRIVEYAHTVRRRRPIPERNDEVRLEHGNTVRYTVLSDLTPPAPAALRAASGPLPKGYDVYLQLPPEITPRTRALAATITAEATTAYDRAVAIQQWLKTSLRYTLELADPGKQEPVDFFLFERKRGHCEYFASAFAILARAAGIPTRQVNGFLGGEWNEYQSYVAVRAGDAHSWAEVFFPGVEGTGAWVTFDATPAADARDRLGRGGDGLRARVGRMLDTLRFQWSKWVIEYDLASQLELFRGLGGALKAGAGATKAALASAAGWVVARWWLAVPLVGGLAILLARRRRRATDRRAGEPARRRQRTPIAAAYERAAQALARIGIARAPATTPRELAAQLTARAHPAAVPLAELVELYYESEWGGRASAEAAARAAALANAVHAAVAAVARSPVASGRRSLPP